VENTGGHSFSEAIAKMGEAFDYLYGEWLPNSPFQLDDKPCLEIYVTPSDAPVIMIDACLPVKAL
jgi:AraC family transcriptional regulator